MNEKIYEKKNENNRKYMNGHNTLEPVGIGDSSFGEMNAKEVLCPPPDHRGI